MSSVTLKLLKPRFSIDYAGVRRDSDGDFVREDLGPILDQAIVIDSAVTLRNMAPEPTLVFATSAGSLRSIAACFRLAGCNAAHLDDGVDVETARKLAGDLGTGRLDVLITINRLAGSTPIPGVRSIVLMRPTLRAEVHERFIARLDVSGGAVAIIDMVDNTGRFPLPAGWEVETITEAPTEIVCDPFIGKLESAPHRSVVAWAGKNPERLILVQRAKNHKPGWTYHAIKSFDADAADRWWRSRSKAS